MIVCHCNVIRQSEIKGAIEDMRAKDPHCLLTPGAVIRNCGKRPNCGGCLPVFARLIADHIDTPDEPGGKRLVQTSITDGGGVSGLTVTENSSGPSSMLAANSYETNADNTGERTDERQREGHRVSKQVSAS